MKEIDNQLSAPEQPGGMPSHPVTFVSNDEPSPMPWPNTWYPVTPIGPETEYPCPCSEGDSGTGSTDNNSVDFSIEFGRFPKWPELSGGRLMLNLNMMDAGLCWGTAFQYEHISQRRLEVTESANTSISRPEEPEDVSRAVVKTEKGFPRYYSFASPNVSGAEALGGTQMFQDRMRRVVVDGVSYLEEVQESGMTMRFRPNSSVFDHIVTPLGVKITFAELAAELQVVRQDAYDEPNMTVEAFNALSLFRLKQVWNKTDGLLDLSNVQNIKWYAPADVAERSNDGTYTVRDGAVPIKTWKLSWTFTDTETMIARAVDEENPEVTQMMLKTLRIEEPGGFISEWRAGLYPDDLTLVKGEGEDAISIVTRCRPANGHENMIAKDVNGQSMVAGGYYTDKKEKFKYVYSGVAGTENAVLCSAEKEVYQRRLYGDVLLSRTEGYETPLERTWTYGYGSDPSSPNYGKRIRETRPDGAVVEMEYDAAGNVIQRTEPWCDDIIMKTVYEYNNAYEGRFNDRRRTREIIELYTNKGFACMLDSLEYYYYVDEASYWLHTIHSYVAQPNSAYANTEWYKEHPSCVYARGRLKKEWTFNGTEGTDFAEKIYDYALCSEYGAIWKCTETLQANGAVVPGKSTKTIHYYAENGDEVATDHQVHVEGEGFVSVGFQQMTYDASHRVIRTDHANGLHSTMEWSCAGPLWKTNERSLQTRYTYDGAKRLVCVEQDAAVPIEDWNDEDMTSICPNTVTKTEYDGAGRLLSVKTSVGDKSTISSTVYDILGRPISFRDEQGRLTGYSYSKDGLATTETLPSGATLVTRRSFSSFIVEESGSGRNACYYTYEPTSDGVIKQTRHSSSTGIIVESEVQNGMGQIVNISRVAPGSSSPNLYQRYVASYDYMGRLEYELKNGFNAFRYQYDVFGNLVNKMRVVPDSSDMDIINQYDYCICYKRIAMNSQFMVDGEHSLIFREKSVCCQPDEDQNVEEYSYELISHREVSLSDLDSMTLRKDTYGRWYWEKIYNVTGNVRLLRGRSGCDYEEEEISLNGDMVRMTDMDGGVTMYSRSYNVYGDTLTVRDVRGKDAFIVNDLAGRETRRTDQDGKITTTVYDAIAGLPSCITTPDGNQTRSVYDIRGHLVHQYGTAVQPMKWEYDDQDHIVALHTYRLPGFTVDVIPSSGSDVTCWEYDSLTGMLLNKSYSDGSKITYRYDELGRMISKTDARGVMTGYEYSMGYLYSIYYHVEDSFSEVAYTPGISIFRDKMGRISEIYDNFGFRSFTYTGFEDVASETTSGMVESVLSYQRDAMGRPSGHVLSLNGVAVQQVSLRYDSLDRLSTASLNGASFTYGYDTVMGWLNRLSYPNGLDRNTAFHANLPLPVSLTYMQGTSSTPELKHAYTWDNMRRPSVREDYVGSTALSRRHTYGYNARGELEEDTMNVSGSFGYAYDNIGNRRTAAEQGISSNYQSNNLNQYVTVTRSGTTFVPVYDTDGNQTSVNTSTGTWSVQYNADNRPVVFTQGSKKVECVYDYLGRRVEKVEYDGNTLTKRTRFVYRGYLMVASMDCTQNTSNPPLLGTWFWDPVEPEATRVLAMCTHNADKSVSSTRYVVHDLLKSVSALFDSAGTRQAKFEYTPYGEILTAEGAWASTMPFRYSCEYHDDDLGLIYYNYRHYNPQAGRWISRDPIGEEGGWNLYGFLGNKINYIDILGQWPCEDECKPPGKCLYNDFKISYVNELNNNALTPDDIDAIENAARIIDKASQFEGIGKYKIPSPIRIVNKSRKGADGLIKQIRNIEKNRIKQGFVLVRVKVYVKKCVCVSCMGIGKKFDWRIIESDWKTYGKGKNWLLAKARNEVGAIIAKVAKELCRDQKNTVTN